MSELTGYWLVGRVEGGVHITPLKIGVAPEALTEDDVAVFKHLCRRAGAVAVCTIRCRRDANGELEYFHSYFSDPSFEDELAKDNALLRIVAAARNPENPHREAEKIVEDVRLYESLGLGGE